MTGRFDPQARHAAQSRGPEELQDELKFAELAATTLHNLREVRLLEHRQSSLRPFFSPVVLDALAGQDPNQVLAPREAEVSVLFCDLRGFSRRSRTGRRRSAGIAQPSQPGLGGDDALHSGARAASSAIFTAMRRWDSGAGPSNSPTRWSVRAARR